MGAMELQIRVLIGLEIHVQVATRSKMFCGCAVEFGAGPNSRTCPVCLGMPGALPVMNRQALELAVRTALALNCKIARHTKWDRKSYYYPDLPKNYQISQYDLPLAYEGWFEVPVSGAAQAGSLHHNQDGLAGSLPLGGQQAGSLHHKRVRIRRAHLEEDAGKNIHDVGEHTRVDLNRAGTPLLEIVTEPDLASAEEAYTFCTELQRLVTYLGVSQGSMQKGQMRFEPNVNVVIDHDGREFRTPIAEIKNLNSFRSVRDAIRFEVTRQVAEWQLDHDYVVKQRPNENRGWDDVRGVTEFQRGKEAAHDYRYFPDPDLVPVDFDDAYLDAIRARLPELPLARKARLMGAYALSSGDADLIVSDCATADLFEGVIRLGGEPRKVTSLFIGPWAADANQRGVSIGQLGLLQEHAAELVRMWQANELSATSAIAIATEMARTNQPPRQIAEMRNLLMVQDADKTVRWVEEAMASHPQAVQDALHNPKKAKASAGFLRGAVMKLSGGKADPKLVGELIEKKLASRGADQV